MASWDLSRQKWRIGADANAKGQPRRRIIRHVAEPNNTAGRKAAELAEMRLRVEVADLHRGGWDGLAADSFAAAGAGWLERNRHAWSPKTVLEVERALRLVIFPVIGSAPLDKVTPRQVQDMYDKDWAPRYAPSTRRRWHGIVAAIFADAERLGDLHGPNPMRRVRPAGGAAPERVRMPAPAEVRRVIAASASAGVAVFFELAAATGARRGSLTALRWRNVDIEAGTVTFTHAVANGPGGQVLKGTKADRPYAVRVGGGALEALRQHRRRAAETALALGLGALDELFVFSDNGGPGHWSVEYPSHAWQVACGRAGVAGVRLHDVRHFAATQMLGAGLPTRVVADRLGCTEANVVKTYSHRVASAEDARAAEVMARVMGG